MSIGMRWVDGAVATALALHATMVAAAVPGYPSRPVRVIVALAPGGGTDISARLLAQKLADGFGQSFVVDNRPGGGAMLGTELAARATPDGYTLFVASPEFTVNPSLQPKATYEPSRDFAPIIQMTNGQYFLSVRPGVAANTVQELIALARSQPRQLNYGSSGNGSANHLAGEMFQQMAGVELTHVPYKGSGPAAAALMSGEIHVLFSSTTAVLQHVRSGRVRALAVTGAKRSPVAPEVPTVAESGVPGFEVTGWYGLLAPRSTPAAIVDVLNAASNRALPELRSRFADLGSEVVAGTPAQFAAFLRADQARWAKVVKASGARPD
jgi:tripartite-type tricarboxylate transporter receptor subunit TctC